MNKKEVIEAVKELWIKEYGQLDDETERSGYFVAGFVANAIINLKDDVVTVPYQCCPVCNGAGKVPADGYTSSVYQPCSVCNGQKIIPQHQL